MTARWMPMVNPKHAPYWHVKLENEFCDACGDEWPCLPYREANPRIACNCSHAQNLHTNGAGQCWLAVCACRTFEEKAS